MDIITIFLIALGLSMDAFAVSVSNGLYYKNFKKRECIYSSLTFGLFQGLMPLVGFIAGALFSDIVSALDHYIALILLGLIGGNMIHEAVEELKSGEIDTNTQKEYTPKTLLLQAVATSIDALAVGVSFAVIKINIVFAVSLIAAITFLCCLFGTALGKKFGVLLKEKAKIFGGLILIIIGLKIFLEHLL